MVLPLVPGLRGDTFFLSSSLVGAVDAEETTEVYGCPDRPVHKLFHFAPFPSQGCFITTHVVSMSRFISICFAREKYALRDVNNPSDHLQSLDIHHVPCPFLAKLPSYAVVSLEGDCSLFPFKSRLACIARSSS